MSEDEVLARLLLCYIWNGQDTFFVPDYFSLSKEHKDRLKRDAKFLVENNYKPFVDYIYSTSLFIKGQG